MEPDNDNQFRYRKSVRCIAMTDICIALFMLGFFGLKVFAANLFVSQSQSFNPKRTPNSTTTYIISNTDHVPHIFIVVCLCIFSVYGIQLLMGQVLLSATYNNDKDVILSRCSKWYWTSQFLNVMQGLELFLLVFSTRGGTPAALGILVMKIIFRAIANHMVKVFMWDLRTPHLPLFALPMTTSHLTRTGMIQMPRQRQGEGPTEGGFSVPSIPMYEPPPSYAEAVREKNFPQDFSQVA